MENENFTQRAGRRWGPIWITLAVCLTIIGLLVSLSPAVEPTPSAYDIAIRKVAAELETLPNHDWAGSYYHGDGLGVNISLSLAPASGFVYAWHGCLGEYDRNYGSIDYKEIVTLEPQLPNVQRGLQGIATEFTLVRWGDRRYLISPDEMIAFCYAVNYGDEPRSDGWGKFLLRKDDWKVQVIGHPSVPTKFRDYLLDEPIVTQVSAVGATQQRGSRTYTTITLDAGADEGVRPGMKFRLTGGNGSPSTYAVAEITDVQPDACEARIKRFADDEAKPEVGWQFSSRNVLPTKK